jgi:CHASE2 domain-containing sensor protein
MSRLRGRLWSTAAVATAAAGLAIAVDSLGLFEPIEGAALDARFEIRGEAARPDGVVIAAIDDDTPLELDDGYPLPRRRHAQAIDRLSAAGARAIAYDITFEDAKAPAGDRAMSASIRRAGNVVLATARVARDGSQNVPFLGQSRDVRDIRAQAGYSGVEAPVARRVPAGTGGVPSLSVAATREAGKAVERDWFTDNELWVDYPGGPGAIETVSFADLVRGRVPDRVVRGRVVVVGSTVSSDHDFHATSAPGDELISGAEIHAAAIASMLSGSPLRDAPGWVLWLYVAVGGALGALAGRRIASIPGIGLFAGAAALILAVNQGLFERDLVVPVGAPLLALGLATAGSIALSTRDLARQRDELRRDFAAFDPRAVQSVLQGTETDLGPAAEQIVSGYRLESLVGRGAMGVVYRATELASQRVVAVKVLPPHLADDPDYRRRFEREAAAASAISSPHILPVYASGEEDGVLFLAMRLVEGRDASMAVKEDGPVDAATAVSIVAAVASALEAAHSMGLIHRDVKPSNILLDTRNDGVYLADFGLARPIDGGTITTERQLLGTLAFAAPEQLRGERLGPAADIYALAGVFHFLVSGRTLYPYEDGAAVMAAHLSAPPPTLDGDCAIFNAALGRALAKAPEARWPTATRFSAELTQAMAVRAGPRG